MGRTYREVVVARFDVGLLYRWVDENQSSRRRRGV